MTRFQKCVFWLCSLTWGLPLTIAGLIVAGVLYAAGYRPAVFGPMIYFEVGERWGGFSLGPVFVVNKGAGKYLKCHEAGHGLQNVLYGPFTLFVVLLPSMCRYWYRQILMRTNNEKYLSLPPYNDVWFEKQASDIGTDWFGKE